MDMTTTRTNFAIDFSTRPIDPIFARIGGGQRKDGVERGPDCLWENGLHAAAQVLPTTPNARAEVSDHEQGLMSALADLADLVETTARLGHRPLTLGGDHSIALSTIEGVLRVHPDARIIYVDAHGDINTPDTSPSGNLHGMPLAAHLGFFSPREVPGIGFVGARLRSNQLAFIGVRDLDRAEATFIDDRNIPCFSADDVAKFGMKAVIHQVINDIDPEGRYPLYVSFDVDSVDPAVAPATGVPVPGGLTPEDLSLLGTWLRRTKRLVGMDLAEVNPALAESHDDVVRTVKVAADFAATCLR